MPGRGCSERSGSCPDQSCCARGGPMPDAAPSPSGVGIRSGRFGSRPTRRDDYWPTAKARRAGHLHECRGTIGDHDSAPPDDPPRGADAPRRGDRGRRVHRRCDDPLPRRRDAHPARGARAGPAAGRPALGLHLGGCPVAVGTVSAERPLADLDRGPRHRARHPRRSSPSSCRLLFIVKGTDVSRLFLVFLFVAQPTVTLVGRLVLRRYLRAQPEPRAAIRATCSWPAPAPWRRASPTASRAIRASGFRSSATSRSPERRITSSRARSSARSTTSRRSSTRGSSTRSRSACHRAAASYLEPITGLAAGEGKTVRDPGRPGRGGPSRRACRRSSTASSSARSSTTASARSGCSLKRLIDIVGAAHRRSSCSARSCSAPRSRSASRDGVAGPLPPGARRPPRPPVHDRQVPDDGPRRRGAADAELAHLNEREGAAFKMDERPAHHAARARGCAGPRSTSCRSCGTC